jgi:hypothetical protein
VGVICACTPVVTARSKASTLDFFISAISFSLFAAKVRKEIDNASLLSKIAGRISPIEGVVA